MTDALSLPDEELARQAAAGSLPAFEALVRRYGPGLDALLGRALADVHLAEDTAQEVWIKVHRALPRYEPRGSFRSWIYSVALNHLRDVARKRGRGRLVLVAEPPEAEAPTAPDPLVRDEERARLERALAAVPEPFRTAVQLVDVLSLSTVEAAAAMACAPGTIKSRVHRGRSLFREQLEDAAPIPLPTRREARRPEANR